MPRALAVYFVLLLLSVYVYSEEPSCKTLLECQARVHSWEQWSNENLPECKQAMKDADRLETENGKLKEKNEDLQSSNDGLEHTRIEINLATAAIGIGIGVMCAFWLVRGLKRLWPESPKAKQLVSMVCGAVWITGAAFIGVNNSDLSRYPGSVLFTVLVYSLPGLLFGGIGFWWFGKGKEKEPTAG